MRTILGSVISLILVFVARAADAATPDTAVRAEGYVGYSQLDLGALDDDGFQGGGVGSVSAAIDRLHLQADVFGDSTDYDDFGTEDVGAGGHVGWRDAERGGLGFVGNYNRFGEDVASGLDVWRAGFEGEAFLDRIALTANAGYLQIDDDSTGYADLGISFHPIDRARIGFDGGLVDIEESNPVGFVVADAEVLFADVVSAFARWEGEFSSSSGVDYEAHSIVFGARLYWGAEKPSLLSYDRTHFKRSCMGYRLIGARMC